MDIISLSELKRHAEVEIARAVFGNWLTDRLKTASTSDDCLILALDLAGDVVRADGGYYRPSSLYVQMLLQELGYKVVKTEHRLVISGWEDE